MMEKDPSMEDRKKSTRAVHLGGVKSSVYGEVVPAVFQTSTFAFPSAEEGAARFAGERPGFIYTRLANPTVRVLEEAVASLEGGSGGVAASTGMGALTTTFLALLEQGAHVVSTDSIYGATHLFLESDLSRFGVRTSFVDTSNPEILRDALGPETRLVFIETPTNPTMKITDLEAAARMAHEHGALLVVDNTFASPYLQRPLRWGADIVVHSLTKFLNGHSDVLGGMVTAKDPQLLSRLRKASSTYGSTMDPHQAWLILRGLRTLALRMERAQENALRLAQYLAGHPKVTWVRYPGLPDHPQHAVARKQMEGFGSMICFGVKNGYEGGVTLMDRVRLITLAVSLGSVESLIEHPASMSHAAVPWEERQQAGILDELVRLSVGCEDFEDLRRDLDQALSQVGK